MKVTVGIILSGHGSFGSGLMSTVKLISGDHEKVNFYDFVEGKTIEDVDNSYSQIIKGFGEDVSDIVILTDLAGGTPFNRAVNLSLTDERIKVISGTNLPLVLTAVMTKDSYEHRDIDDYIESLISEGQSGVTQFKLKDKISDDLVEEDGI